MRRSLLILICFFLSCSAWAQEANEQVQANGQVQAEVRDQIGVYEVDMPNGTSWVPGDIVEVSRADKRLGEATVMSVEGGAGYYLAQGGL